MNWIKGIVGFLVPIVTLFVALCSLEIFLFFDDKSQPVNRVSVEFNGRDYAFLQRSNAPFHFSAPNKRPNVFVVGDSFVEGVVCENEKKNFPGHLSQMVSKEVEVVNLGIEGMNPVDYITWLEELRIERGDTVIVTLYDNDVHLSPENCRDIIKQSKRRVIYTPKFCLQGEGIIDKSNETFLQKLNNKIKTLRLVKLTKEAVVNIPGIENLFYRSQFRSRWTDFNSEENQWIVSSITSIKSIVEEKKGEIFFVYYPNTNAISNSDPRHMQWRTFIEFVDRKQQITIEDPYPFFIDHAEEKSMVWSLTDKHPNCSAHLMMAKFVYEKLLLNK